MSDTFDADDFCDMTPPKMRERTHWATCWDLPGHERCAVARMVRVQELANKQALDDGLWFRAELITEEKLQIALRLLHAVIEGKA